ncbi:MAG: hypothetical protein IJ496_05600 [Ruminococcus sp.]|nr:hypothetical protein [Ruminococcus sp.]
MSKHTASKKKPNKIWIAGIALILAAAAMLGGGLYLILSEDEVTPSPGSVVAVGEEDSATACQNLLSSYYTAIIGQDGQALYELMAPPEYWDYYMETYDKTETEVIETYQDAVNNTVASWKADCGSNVKVSFQIEASGEQTEAFLTEWSDTMNEALGEEVLSAQEALTLQVTQTVTGDNGTKETQLRPTLIRVNDAWYILDEGTDAQSAE